MIVEKRRLSASRLKSSSFLSLTVTIVFTCKLQETLPQSVFCTTSQHSETMGQAATKLVELAETTEKHPLVAQLTDGLVIYSKDFWKDFWLYYKNNHIVGMGVAVSRVLLALSYRVGTLYVAHALSEDCVSQQFRAGQCIQSTTLPEASVSGW